MNTKKYITQPNNTKYSNNSGSYNPKYTQKKSQFYRKAPRWLLCKQRLINKRGVYLKHVYVNVTRVIVHKYMHLILMWWYLLSHRYLLYLQQVHQVYMWGEYYIFSYYPHLVYPVQVIANYSPQGESWAPAVNPYKWAIRGFIGKKRGVYARRRNKRGGFFRIRRNPQGHGKYLPPKQYSLLKAFYSPSHNQGWEEQFTLPINIFKVRGMITHPRGGFERKRYLFVNFTAFTVRGRNKSYLYYTNIK